MRGNLSTKGFVKVLGHKLFHRSFRHEGKRKGTVLCLHGGPGMTHDYILPLSDLSKYGYDVFFYDQLGCGRSERPPNIALFTIERAVEEVENFRKVMSLGRIHLIGSSYGGLLAMAYALKYQRRLKSLVTIGGYANVPLTLAEMERMKSELPRRMFSVMKNYEERGEYENPRYLKAVLEFYKRHLCRLRQWPEELVHSLKHVSKPVYYTMNGPNEFTIIGNTRYWDITEKLGKIHVPTLVTCGRYDEVSPKVARSIHNGIKGSKLVVFRKSSHLPMWEEREPYIRVVADFLRNAG